MISHVDASPLSGEAKAWPPHRTSFLLLLGVQAAVICDDHTFMHCRAAALLSSSVILGQWLRCVCAACLHSMLAKERMLVSDLAS